MKGVFNPMLEMIKALVNNGGLTLKRGKAVNYSTGYQVADEGVEATTAEGCVKAIEAFRGTCGVWYSEGVYYIDHSFRVKTKSEALAIGRAHNQQTILKWADMSLIDCQTGETV